MTTPNTQIDNPPVPAAEVFKDNMFWFDQIYWLPSLVVNMPDEFHEAVFRDEDIPDELLKKAGFDLRYVKQYRKSKESSDECSEWLIWNDGERTLKGFIIYAGAYSTNAFKDVRLKEDGTYSMGTFSPGWTTHEWIYAETLEDAMTQGAAWVQANLKEAYEAKLAGKDDADEEE